MKKIYFAFLDEHNQITIVRYKSQEQIEICEKMPFVRGIFDAFEAEDQFDARRKILAKWHEMQNEQKRLN